MKRKNSGSLKNKIEKKSFKGTKNNKILKNFPVEESQADDEEVFSQQKEKEEEKLSKSVNLTKTSEEKSNGNRVRSTSVGSAKKPEDNVDTDFLNDKIEISGDISVTPIDSFQHPSLNKSFLPVFSKFQSPTPIQSYTWPILFQDRDVIAIAKTGSGKTLSFGVPCVQRIEKSKKPSMLVLAPTRELAIQIHEVLTLLARKMGLKCIVIYGGASRMVQASNLDSAHIIVATPGRLLDFLNTGFLDVSQVSYLIIDEADQMLDMGFEPDMTAINGFLPPVDKRLTAMFSATWPIEVQELADMFLNNPIQVSVGKATGTPQANKSITQNIQFFTEPKLKLNRLMELIKEIGNGKRVLVFTTTKIETNILSSALKKSGINASDISSNLSQAARERVLNLFKSGRINVLVATDVASRGLDIPNVESVINYSFPQTIEAYVHRIGRTGRAGKKGVAYTFLTPQEYVPIYPLIQVLKKSDQTVPPELYSFKSKNRRSINSRLGGSNGRYNGNGNNNNNQNRFKSNFNNYNQKNQNNNKPIQNNNKPIQNNSNNQNSTKNQPKKIQNNNKNQNNNSNLNNQNNKKGGEKGGALDESVLKNLKNDPKKLAALVNFINSLN